MIATDPKMKKDAEREALRAVIQQWNANRLDLFELSEPNEGTAVLGEVKSVVRDVASINAASYFGYEVHSLGMVTVAVTRAGRKSKRPTGILS
ncbi:hypothetical protein RUM43_011413 [Polyplax serrata]|uniref:Uncharacterized protein n=1 Tax=Polyplax serrata TaxID=468196 RepID=A0AAN8S119_POLSC